ncbi:hypothetical protein [Bradyrhizobium lablabi]|uniref:hypothetical protein n=1 Tax=Bradyrhizobium lablabi TaxID=722472 RepID=UPI001BA7B684|nr:hypothetical protein [Bradyrhizobium lablabi]MBR0696115.1 hypothetical protein [Bradyrhizobium lablabi]
MAGAIEITTFGLKGFSCADFVEANADIDRWLKRQAGFLSRRIAERGDGTIVDMLLWRSADEAEHAASRIMSETASSKVHAMIDHGTVNWTVAPIHHTIETV